MSDQTTSRFHFGRLTASCTLEVIKPFGAGTRQRVDDRVVLTLDSDDLAGVEVPDEVLLELWEQRLDAYPRTVARLKDVTVDGNVASGTVTDPPQLHRASHGEQR